MPWVLPSLESFSGVKVFLLIPGQKVFVHRLKVVPNLAPTGNYYPPVMKDLGLRLRTWFSTAEVRPSRRIWISRLRAPRRKLVNEAELHPILSRYGIEVVFMEDLTFGDQVRLLAQASVLFGLHGAGLVNMLFLAKGSSVVEIRIQGDRSNNCYFSLASALDLDYYFLETSGPLSGHPLNGGHELVPGVLEAFLRRYVDHG